jgi:hypothetical protein
MLIFGVLFTVKHCFTAFYVKQNVKKSIATSDHCTSFGGKAQTNIATSKKDN